MREYKSIQNSQISLVYIPHFTIFSNQISQFTKFKILFLAVLKNFPNSKACLKNKFSDLKNFDASKETKIYVHSWKDRTEISITAKFDWEIL